MATEGRKYKVDPRGHLLQSEDMCLIDSMFQEALQWIP